MRVVIAGAGNVGRSIARELIISGHHVLLIDKDPAAIKPESVPEAEWLLADACELTSLQDAGIEVLHESVNWKHSTNGKYVSVRIRFRANSREEYDRAHQALRDHPEVKWTV